MFLLKGAGVYCGLLSILVGETLVFWQERMSFTKRLVGNTLNATVISETQLIKITKTNKP